MRGKGVSSAVRRLPAAGGLSGAARTSPASRPTSRPGCANHTTPVGRGYLTAGFRSARGCTSSGRPQAHYWCGRVGRTHCCVRPPSEPGRARFRAPGSSKPLRLVGGQTCQAAAVAAADVYETGFVGVRHRVLRGDDLGDSLAGARQPRFPLARGLWSVVVG